MFTGINAADAELVTNLFFRPAGVSDAQALGGNILLPAGTQLTGVEVVLQESASGGMASRFATGNLIFFDATLSAAGSDGSIGLVSTNTNGIDDSTPADNDRLSGFTFGGGLSPTLVSTTGGTEVREFILGAAQLNAPSIDGESTVFSVLDSFPGNNGDFALDTGGLLILDTFIMPATLTLTASAVPEPSTLSLALLASGGLIARRRR